MIAPPLESMASFFVAANVRGALDLDAIRIAPGLGRAGDLVLGRVETPSGSTLRLLDSDRRSHEIGEPFSVVAVLGPRDSSTHVCATIPPDGLAIEQGTKAYWVAGESGIVGCLERPPAPSSMYAPERAVPFRCDGLLRDAEGIVNIRRFAVRSRCPRVTVPVVLVAATSSEAGKTVLAGALIRRLSAAGVRIGALKVTGTGGVMDSMHHAECGAVATFDQVDAGLITTHGDAAAVRERIPLLFRRAQELGADLVIAELGGDLVSANNPALFELPELMDRAVLMTVIANDALAAAGVMAVNASRLRFPVDRIRFLSSPFRNHAGMCRRMAAVGVTPVLDPRSSEDIDRIADEITALARLRCDVVAIPNRGTGAR